MKNIFDILDRDYVWKLFKDKKLIYFPELEGKDLIVIEIEKISPNWAKETCLAKYKIFFSGGDIIKIIRGKASLSEDAMRVWRIMEYLYNNDFSGGQFQIAKPLDFVQENNFILYEEAQGSTLFSIIQSGDFEMIIACIKKSAAWLAKLHKINAIEENLSADIFIRSNDFVDIFSKLSNLFPDFKYNLILESSLKFIDDIQIEEKILIHNDFYPGNIIIGSEVIYGIDFEKSGFGSRWLDVATFLSWLAFPVEIKQFDLTSQKIQKMQAAFFETYCLYCQLDYLLAKQYLNKYFVKIYLDQIYYYTVFCLKGWDFFGAEDKYNYEIKIKALLNEINKNLK